MHPYGLKLWKTDSVTTTPWATHAQMTIASGGGIAIPFIGDGT